MSRVPWHLFQDRQRRAHLVVAVIALPDGPPGGDELAAAQSVLTRLVKKYKLTGDYAATVVRDTGRPEAYFAFEDEADAAKLAAILKAKVTRRYPGWATQRVFRLDGAMVTALAASLAAPEDAPQASPGGRFITPAYPTSQSMDPEYAARVSQHGAARNAIQRQALNRRHAETESPLCGRDPGRHGGFAVPHHRRLDG